MVCKFLMILLFIFCILLVKWGIQDRLISITRDCESYYNIFTNNSVLQYYFDMSLNWTLLFNKNDDKTVTTQWLIIQKMLGLFNCVGGLISNLINLFSLNSRLTYFSVTKFW